MRPLFPKFRADNFLFVPKARKIGRGLTLGLIFLSACGPSAKKDLQRMNIPFTTDSFLQSAKDGNNEVLKLFLDAGMNVNERNEKGRTALLEAVAANRPETVRTLLERGADPNADAEDGRPPVLIASLEGSAEVVSALLSKGASTESAGKDGMTLLMAAARGGNATLVKRLLDEGANVNAADIYGNTPLINATLTGQVEIAKMLLEHGADPNAKTGKSRGTALHTAAIWGKTEVAKLLLDHGAEINAHDEDYGMTPLTVASLKGHADLVELLAAKGADVGATDKRGNSPLILASDEGNEKVIGALIKGGADVNAKGEDGVTPLIAASLRGKTAVVKALIDAGADVKLITQTGYSAKAAAKDEGHPEIVKMLEEAGAVELTEYFRIWDKFASDQRSYTPPPDWTVHDPFSDKTAFQDRWTLLGAARVRENAKTCRALFLPPDETRGQMFLILGDAEEWRRKIHDRVGDLSQYSKAGQAENHAQTADGAPVSYWVFNSKGEDAGDNATTYFLATATVGDSMMIVDAGGPAASFDQNLELDFLRGIRLGSAEKEPTASDAPAEGLNAR